MKKVLMLFIMFIVLPYIVCAKGNETILAEQTKYYKTIYFDNELTYMMNNSNISRTLEITKDEYDSYEKDKYSLNGTIETEYKKLTVTISSINSYYRYKVNLEWKSIPKIRSYDTIAIGFPASVKPKLRPIFSEDYCTDKGKCYNTTGYHFLYSGDNGVGVTFQVPTGNLKSLNQTLYVDMQKNTSSTIIAQYAYGDYAHAVKTISLNNAQKYKVNTGGIIYEDTSITYYDAISTAKATWNGNW